MNYGFNMGAASVLASMHRQDIAANNLANIQTVGFKPDFATLLPRQAARQEDGLFNLPSNALLERLGAGVLFAPTRTGFTQGMLQQTHNALDLAITGSGFLSVSDTTKGNPTSVRYTRDGRLALDTQGNLVLASDNRKVLDESGSPITIDPTLDVKVLADGTIAQGGAAVAKLGFVDFADKSVLQKIGDNLFSALPSAQTSPSAGRIVQNAIEQSAADPIKSMMEVQDASQSLTATVKVMQIQDEMMSRAINTLGRVTS